MARATIQLERLGRDVKFVFKSFEADTRALLTAWSESVTNTPDVSEMARAIQQLGSEVKRVFEGVEAMLSARLATFKLRSEGLAEQDSRSSMTSSLTASRASETSVRGVFIRLAALPPACE